jgi:hypothetical protein
MTASITISIELELAWGVHDNEGVNKYHFLSKNRAKEEIVLTNLLELCENADVPITFDVVGHLLLDSCDGEHDGSYPEGWFQFDPGTDSAHHPLYYAPKLVKKIVDSPIPHEIATHMFSHPNCNYFSDEAIDKELKLVRKTHNQYGLAEPASIVAPNHSPIPKRILSEHGIQNIRIPIRDTNQRTNLPLTSLNLLSRTHPLRQPKLVDGVVEMYTSPWPSLTSSILPTGQDDLPPPLKYIPLRTRQYVAMRYLSNALQQAIKYDTNLHLWTHVFNMANDAQFQLIKSFFDIIAEKIKENEIEVKTMKQLGDEVRKNNG